MKLKPRDYQIEAINRVRDELRAGKRAPIINGATGCHAAGQEILMYDGTMKRVEDVAIGDTVMGWDSTPRRVFELHRGEDEMVAVTPVKGSPFVVNKGHILTLYRTNDGKIGAGGITDISINEYLESNKTFKHVHKLFRVPVLSFGGSDRPLPIDPYFLGVLIGDGSIVRGVGVSKPDKEIREEVYRQASIWGLRVRVSDDTSSATLHMARTDRSSPNPLSLALMSLGLFGKLSGEKFVPQEYKTSGMEQRLSIIAGLLDTDGHPSGGGYDFISKSKLLSEDVVFLCRSVGLSAYTTECTKSCQNGFSGIYWRVSISGDCSRVPCRIKRKVAPARLQKKNHLVAGFSVEASGRGRFYGFTIEGDGRYLMGDFTVTHNSGKTVLAAYIIEQAVAKGSKVIFLYRGSELGTQTSEKLDAIGVRHGIIQAGNLRRNSYPVQVASAETLINRLRKKGHIDEPFIPQADVLIIDECHEAPSNTIREIISHYESAIRIGLSATPTGRSDGQGLDDIFDCIVPAGTTRQLIDEGYLSPFVIYDSPMQLDFSGVHLKGGDFNEQEVTNIIDKPKVIGSVYENWKLHADGKKTLVFAMSRVHGQHLCAEFRARGEKFIYLDGVTPLDERRRAVADFKKPGLSGGITGIVSVALFLRGFDVPDLECISMARPTMSLILYLQSFGRGLRIAPGKAMLTYLDHGNNVSRHGFPDEDREWSLEGKRRKVEKECEGSTTTCEKCYAILPSGTKICPRCGHTLTRVDEEDLPKTAENVILTKKEREAAKQAIVAGEIRELQYLVEAQESRGYRWNYAITKFREKFDHYPRKKHGAKLHWVSGPEGWHVTSWEFGEKTYVGNQ